MPVLATIRGLKNLPVPLNASTKNKHVDVRIDFRDIEIPPVWGCLGKPEQKCRKTWAEFFMYIFKNTIFVQENVDSLRKNLKNVAQVLKPFYNYVLQR